MTLSKHSLNPIEPAEAPKEQGLGRRAFRAAGFLLGGFGAGQVLRLLGNLVLTRLLFEEAFGLMALVTVFLVGLHLFSDIGIGPSIVQSPNGDEPEFLDTAWTIQIARGFALWIACLVGAWPFASWYGDERLGPLLMVAGTTSLITGFQSTKTNLADRNLNQRQIAALELSSQAAGLVLTVTLAFVFRSIWALIAGALFADLVRVALSHIYLPGPRNRIRYEREAATRMMRFGRWIFVSTLLTFCVTQSDRLIFGKLVPLALLGVYSIGANIAAIGPSLLNVLANHILFPMYSRLVQGGGDLKALFVEVRLPVLVAGGFMLSGFAAGGPAAIELLYDSRYYEAGWIVQLLSTGAWFALLSTTNSNAFLAKGRSNLMAGTNLAKLAGMAVCIPLGHHVFGFQGAVAGYAASEVCRYGFSTIAAHRLGFAAFRQDVFMTLWFAAASAIGIVALRSVSEASDGHLPRVLAVFVAVSIAWLPWALRLGIPLLVRTRAQGQV